VAEFGLQRGSQDKRNLKLITLLSKARLFCGSHPAEATFVVRSALSCPLTGQRVLAGLSSRSVRAWQ
jgi:hypothetical protein